MPLDTAAATNNKATTMVTPLSPTEVLALGLEIAGFDLHTQNRLNERTKIRRFRSNYGCCPKTCTEILNDIHASRAEYQAYPLPVFRDHITQEKRHQKEKMYWMVKKEKKEKEKQEKQRRNLAKAQKEFENAQQHPQQHHCPAKFFFWLSNRVHTLLVAYLL